MATKKSKTQVVDAETGEITIVRGARKAFAIPDPKTITPIDQVAGKNPAAVNLRDHPEFNGMEVIVMDARFSDSTLGGKKGTYLVAACYVVAPGATPKEDNFTIIMTGSENVQGRIADALLIAEESGGTPFPLKGTLRNAGRAWFLD